MIVLLLLLTNLSFFFEYQFPPLSNFLATGVNPCKASPRSRSRVALKNHRLTASPHSLNLGRTLPPLAISTIWSQDLCCVKHKALHLQALLHCQWPWQHIVTSFDPPRLHFRVLASNPTIHDFRDSNYIVRRLTRAISLQAISGHSRPPVSKRARSSIRIAFSPLPAPRLSKRCSKRRR